MDHQEVLDTTHTTLHGMNNGAQAGEGWGHAQHERGDQFQPYRPLRAQQGSQPPGMPAAPYHHPPYDRAMYSNVYPGAWPHPYLGFAHHPYPAGVPYPFYPLQHLQQPPLPNANMQLPVFPAPASPIDHLALLRTRLQNKYDEAKGAGHMLEPGDADRIEGALLSANEAIAPDILDALDILARVSSAKRAVDPFARGSDILATALNQMPVPVAGNEVALDEEVVVKQEEGDGGNAMEEIVSVEAGAHDNTPLKELAIVGSDAATDSRSTPVDDSRLMHFPTPIRRLESTEPASSAHTMHAQIKAKPVKKMSRGEDMHDEEWGPSSELRSREEEGEAQEEEGEEDVQPRKKKRATRIIHSEGEDEQIHRSPAAQPFTAFYSIKLTSGASKTRKIGATETIVSKKIDNGASGSSGHAITRRNPQRLSAVLKKQAGAAQRRIRTTEAFELANQFREKINEVCRGLICMTQVTSDVELAIDRWEARAKRYGLDQDGGQHTAAADESYQAFEDEE